MHHNPRRSRPAWQDFVAGSHAGGGSSLDTPENIATREREEREELPMTMLRWTGSPRAPSSGFIC